MEQKRSMRPSRAGKQYFIWSGLFSLLLLSCLVAACFGPWAFEHFSLSLGVALGVLVGIWMLRQIFHWLSAQDLFAPWIAFPIGYVIWFSVGSIDIFAEPYPPPYGAIILGFACYLAGVWLAWAIWRPGKNNSDFAFCDDWSDTRFYSLLTVTAGVALLAYFSIALQMGIPALHSEAGEKRLDLLQHGPSQSIFLCGAWTIFVFFLARLWTTTGRRVTRAGMWIVVGLTSLLLLSLGSRGLLLTPLATAIVVRHYILRRTQIFRLVGVALPTFVIASFFGWTRDIMANQGIRFGDVEFDSAGLYYLYYYIRTPVTTLRDIMAEIPRSVPYQHGYLSFGALASLLPGHHESSDVFFRRILGSEFVGFGQPATLLGPMYGDFGIIGIVVQMFVFGIFSVGLYSWMLKKPTVLKVMIYAWVCQVALFSLFGSLFTYVITLILPVGWLVLGRFLRVPTGAVRQLCVPGNAVEG